MSTMRNLENKKAMQAMESELEYVVVQNQSGNTKQKYKNIKGM